MEKIDNIAEHPMADFWTPFSPSFPVAGFCVSILSSLWFMTNYYRLRLTENKIFIIPNF